VADLLPISALQHLLYCERQCALIHVEREWTENRFTAEGRAMHERAHGGPSETRPSVRIARGLSVASERLGLAGECDVVEFHRDGRVIPVEYKRGKPKAHRADEVQLCAQALSLEERLGVEVPLGHLFYGAERRRFEVSIDEGLRRLTETLAARLRTLIEDRELPAADYERRKCSACSLLNLCQPGAPKSARRWFHQALQSCDPI